MNNHFKTSVSLKNYKEETHKCVEGVTAMILTVIMGAKRYIIA